MYIFLTYLTKISVSLIN